MPVSIHAPTRGATNSFCLASIFLRFQFTRPRGARRATQDFPAGCARFNSRAHEGRDRRRRQDRHAGGRFQFTRPRGARHACAEFIGGQCQFQFTRPRGARPATNILSGATAGVSIHAPTRGATRRTTRASAMTEFQFTRPRGARRGKTSPNRRRFCFNSRAHEGRDDREDRLAGQDNRFNSRAHEGRDFFLG